jgi:hypothetical protein
MMGWVSKAGAIIPNMVSNFALFRLTGASLALVLVVLFLVLVFEIAMLINAIRNKHITSNAKVLWIVGMFILHPFVAIAYFFTDYKKTK